MTTIKEVCGGDCEDSYSARDDGWMMMMMTDTHSVTASGLYLLVCSQAASACTETFLPDTQWQLTVKGNKARQTLRCNVSAS